MPGVCRSLAWRWQAAAGGRAPGASALHSSRVDRGEPDGGASAQGVRDLGNAVDVLDQRLEALSRCVPLHLDVVGDLGRDGRTRSSAIPATWASRNRSFEMQPATARYSSSPPLKPSPPPPAPVGRSINHRIRPAAPMAVASPFRLRVSTSNGMLTLPTSLAAPSNVSPERQHPVRIDLAPQPWSRRPPDHAVARARNARSAQGVRWRRDRPAAGAYRGAGDLVRRRLTRRSQSHGQPQARLSRRKV